jgi:glucose uptake protein
MVAAIWGVFIWKEFEEALAGTTKLLYLMLLIYFVGLFCIVYAKI